MYKDYDILTEQPDDPWGGVLSATMFAMRATYHTTTQATPSQLVFGRDAILNIKFEADWNLIRQPKQQIIDYNNRQENKKRIAHSYRPGDKVLLTRNKKTKYGEPEYVGPYRIVAARPNDAYVRVGKGNYVDTINLRHVHPFKEPPNP